jgi:hypothetical protein
MPILEKRCLFKIKLKNVKIQGMIRDLSNHLTDQEFFTYVKFFDMILNKKNIDQNLSGEISTHYLSIGDEDSFQRFSRLYDFVEYKDLPVKIIESHYSSGKFSVESYNAKPGNPTKEEISKIYSNIATGKNIKYSESGRMSWAWINVYDATRFLPYEYETSEEIKKVYKGKVDTYLQNLIDGKLSLVKKNYYTFPVLKEAFIRLIEERGMIQLFGRNFVIKEEVYESGNLKKDSNFCIIQTAYALEYLGYLTVNNVWRDDVYGDSNTKYYVALNISVNDNFVDEINNRYKKANPKNIITGFDKSKGVLKFAGEEINLSLKGKETDASLLMNTLFKRDDTDWVYNDEILADWQFNDADKKKAPKNKVYFAAKKINEKVAMKTKIEDLIEFTTEKARINPRYNQIDE